MSYLGADWKNEPKVLTILSATQLSSSGMYILCIQVLYAC